ncbi:MAG: radical SAM protein [Verrucomicrobia bacterium]|nr:radical SAM protein [Verrucomicrobiota bacterium]
MAGHRKLDALLINPGSRLQIYQSLGSELAGIEPPIWCGLIATFLRRRGISVAILDANAEGLTPEEAAQRVVEADPLLAAVISYGHNPSASTQVMPYASALCTALKELAPQIPRVMAGGHVAALPERTLHEEAVDAVCTGEGPVTLFELAQALKTGQPDYSKVRGLCYRDNDGGIRLTPPAPLVTNLDEEMPELAWDLLPMDRYKAHNWHCFGHLDRRKPYGSIYTTLGCPYHCTFCCIQAPFKTGEAALGMAPTVNSYRLWSPKTVVDQIEKLVTTYGVYNVKFADELFVLNARHIHGVCDAIIERGLKVNIWAYARVDSVRDDATIAKLQRAGVNWLCFGIESASARVRDDARKGFSQDQLFKVIERVRAAGIRVIANYIFGLPEDDLQTMQETLDTALALNCEFANFYCAMAYPGSQLYQTATDQAWPLPEHWSGYSQHAADTLPLPTKHIAGADVLRFRDQAFQAYFHNPKYLEMIERTFGQETVNHIREMASHKLVRKHL